MQAKRDEDVIARKAEAAAKEIEAAATTVMEAEAVVEDSETKTFETDVAVFQERATANGSAAPAANDEDGISEPTTVVEPNVSMMEVMDLSRQSEPEEKPAAPAPPAQAPMSENGPAAEPEPKPEREPEPEPTPSAQRYSIDDADDGDERETPPHQRKLDQEPAEEARRDTDFLGATLRSDHSMRMDSIR